MRPGFPVTMFNWRAISLHEEPYTSDYQRSADAHEQIETLGLPNDFEEDQAYATLGGLTSRPLFAHALRRSRAVRIAMQKSIEFEGGFSIYVGQNHRYR
jgi:hypothetical protein